MKQAPTKKPKRKLTWKQIARKHWGPLKGLVATRPAGFVAGRDDHAVTVSSCDTEQPVIFVFAGDDLNRLYQMVISALPADHYSKRKPIMALPAQDSRTGTR